MNQPHDDPTQLAEQLINNMMQEAQRLAADTHHLLMPISEFRTTLREQLIKSGDIINYSNTTPPQKTLAAVDGAAIIEPLYACDQIWAVAASANGLNNPTPQPLQQAHYAQILPHSAANNTLKATAMAVLETKIITTLTQQIRIIDGSFQTPFITILTAASNPHPQIAQKMEQLLEENITYIETLANPNTWGDTNIIALPKSDSSHTFFDLYRRYMKGTPPTAPNDKFLASQILNPGEMFFPRHAEEIARMGAKNTTDQPDTRNPLHHLSDRILTALTPLKEAASLHQRRMGVTYLKPETADTVIKIENLCSDAIPTTQQDPHAESTALTETKNLAKMLSMETPGPHLQEPYPQYVVDLVAKKISPAAKITFQAMLNTLPEEAEPYIPFLTREYRT